MYVRKVKSLIKSHKLKYDELKTVVLALRYMYHEHCMNFQITLMQECSANILKNIFTCIYVNYLHHFVLSKIMKNISLVYIHIVSALKFSHIILYSIYKQYHLPTDVNFPQKIKAQLV